MKIKTGKMYRFDKYEMLDGYNYTYGFIFKIHINTFEWMRVGTDEIKIGYVNIAEATWEEMNDNTEM